MREFSKKFTKPHEMDMKKIPKSRMEDFERRQQREREKHRRQQVQSTERGQPLFPEPRRINPSEVDDDIAAKLGDHAKAIEFISSNAVGIGLVGTPIPHNAVPSSLLQQPLSASSSSSQHASLSSNSISSVGSSSATTTRLLAPTSTSSQQQQQPPHHYQQAQQQSRQLPYLKQADNKPPYNGRGGYPGQPVKNDLRSSSGMAPPKGPPPPVSTLLPPPTINAISSSGNSSSSSSNTFVSSLLLPPSSSSSSTLLPNGCLVPSSSASKSATTTTTHNGHFSKPLPNVISKIIKAVHKTYRAPEQITQIAATPHTTIAEYNLNGPNRFKYAFVDPIQPLGSPPSGTDLVHGPAPIPITPITPIPKTPAPIANIVNAPASLIGTTVNNTATSAATTAHSSTTKTPTVRPLSKDTSKTVLAEEATPILEKQNSTLENDLELSESDDDRRKQNNSTHNTSDSSQTDSSESGSEESSKSEHQQILPSHQKTQQQSQLMHTHHSISASSGQSTAVAPLQKTQSSRSTPSSLNIPPFNDKTKGNDSAGGIGRTNIYLSSNTLGSAGSSSSGPSSTSSSNKTPSPSDSNKWNLSRYFNKKATQQTQNETPANTLIANSFNINEPTMLPGGAQIIPEATTQPITAIVKNEASYSAAKNLSTQSDDEDDCEESCTPNTVKVGTVPTLLEEIKKESDMLYPNALIKASAGNNQTVAQSQQQMPLLPSEFVAIPTNQIKHEGASMSIAGGMTTVTPFGGKRSPAASGAEKSTAENEYMRISRLSAPSSISNSSDEECTPAPKIPKLVPGDTLKIPGVPAAITALPPSPPQPPAPAPTLPNSITVLPIDPVPTRRRQLKKQKSAATVQHIDTSDEEEGTTSYKLGQSVTVSPAALRAAAGPGGKLYVEPSPPAKKGPGRPRKPQGSAVIPNSSVTTGSSVKGPVLTAKKEVSGVTTVAKKPTARRRVSRANSTAVTAVPVKTPPPPPPPPPPSLPPQQQQSQGKTSRTQRSSSVDSSSSSSASKSSSSSSSDSEAGSGESGSASSSDDENAIDESSQTAAKVAVPPTSAVTAPTSSGRRIVQLNKRKSSLDDIATAPVKPTASATTKRSRAQFEVEDDDDDSSSGSASDDSSMGNYPPSAPVTKISEHSGSASTRSAGGLSKSGNTGGSSHRSQNQQVSSSCSSSSSSSSSSSGEHSDTDRVSSVRGKGNARGGANSAKLRRDKPKASDKNKKDTLTRIFNPKEGGAKKQGQVLVIDQSGDQCDYQHQQQQLQQQKLISPNNALRTGSQENLVAAATTASFVATAAHSAQSPRLTPGHMKSPRSLPPQLLSGSHRTPDRSSSSAERKMQQQRIKTPTRTPTRTPPTTRTPTPTPAAIAASSQTNVLLNANASAARAPSLICKLDLSRLRIPAEWHANKYRLYGAVVPNLQSAGANLERRAIPHFDHETILNADLQATKLGRLNAVAVVGNSGSSTPHSSGNHTPTTLAGNNSERERERELSRSRESPIGVSSNSNSKQRLSYVNTNGRLSSRSMDGGSGGTTPKEVPTAPNTLNTPNGYTAHGIATVAGSNSPSAKPIAGLKHEHIKHEPDVDTVSNLKLTNDTYCNETKFKAGGAVKQELFKQDFKPNDLYAEKQLSLGSPMLLDTKPRRKRSSSSSPYKEKKRKKEKYAKEAKESGIGTDEMMLTPPPTGKEKDITGKTTAMVGDVERVPPVAVVMSVGVSNNGQIENLVVMENQQLQPTNHDRLLPRQSQHMLQHHSQLLQQQSHLGNVVAGAIVSPAHLQIDNNNTIMPPPAGDCGGMSQTSPAIGVASNAITPTQQRPKLVYRSYFERDEDPLIDELSKNGKFLQEAITRKHAADREQNLFSQVTLYLEAVVYFLLSGWVMEQHRSSEEATWIMYKDTLALIKFISTKFKHLQVSSPSYEAHNKVAILSLRCQSLISLKLYKMKRVHCRNIINICAEFFKSGRNEILNGNTPSSNSPSNSVCSQGSGSNTPPGRVVRQDVHHALNQENAYLNYLASSHELWDQADRLVRQGNYTDFFIALDHENGPLTLHSSMYEVFHYVQAGLKQLKGTTNSSTNITSSNTNAAAFMTATNPSTTAGSNVQNQ